MSGLEHVGRVWVDRYGTVLLILSVCPLETLILHLDEGTTGWDPSSKIYPVVGKGTWL